MKFYKRMKKTMLVFCVFQRFENRLEAPDGSLDILEYDQLEAIRLSQKKAQEYINEQPPEIRPRLHIEHWNAE